MDPATIIAALLPFVQHAGKAIIAKWTKGAGAEPQTVGEAVQLGELDIRRLEAFAQIEGAYKNTAAWVDNVRAMQRPVVAGVTLVTWAAASLTPNFPADVYAQVSTLAGVVFSYLFADRTAMHIFRQRLD